jgi:hypothetical protein
LLSCCLSCQAEEDAMIGQMLGPYRVLEKLGVGGMGEVYKAHDTRLDRSVAIKVLPPAFSTDPERRARFEREAKTIAGLNHPHICTLHDVGEHDGSTFLVMEHLQGETLAERLTKGPLALEQALTVASEIADALAAAHRQGVIHRDLKPGNVMLTKAGAKLLDFGLAKLKGHGERPAAAQLMSVATQSIPLTGEGVILGTLQYMAPEQLEGKAADARTDLWALGAILYEMLTGKRAFEGTSAASLIGAILEREPPALATLQPLTPPLLDRVVKRCLAKDPEGRWDSAHDVADELRWLRETSGVAVPVTVRSRRRRVLGAALLAAALAIAAAFGAGLMWWLRPASLVLSIVRSVLTVDPAEELNAGSFGGDVTLGGSQTALTWTPDGQALVFVGRRASVQQLYVRRLDADVARPLPNTDGAKVPAVSPDGQWVAFWAGGALKKVPFEGGPVVEVGQSAEAPWGLAWDAHGSLLAGREAGGIWTIPSEGKPAQLTTVGEGELSHELPSLLPGGRVLLYTVRKRGWSWGDEEVVAQRLPSGERKVLLTGAADARYVPTGHLLFLRRGTLWAVPFDAERLEKRGQEVPVRDRIVQALSGVYSGDVTGAGQFAISTTGTLAYLSGPVADYPHSRLVTVDRHGTITPLSGAVERSYWAPVRLSSDQRRLAVGIQTLTEIGLWVLDLTRQAPLLPLTTDGEVEWFMWKPGAQEVVFSWLKNGRWALATQVADGTAPSQVLVEGKVTPSSVGPNACIAGVTGTTIDQLDIVTVTVENGKARVDSLIQTATREFSPEFSPDGRWLLYGSAVTGQSEVYVRAYPEPGATFPVSAEGGFSPAWHPNGREIFFVSWNPAGKLRMMAVAFTPGSPPTLGRPVELFGFDTPPLLMPGIPSRCYDVAADGQRFFAVQRIPSPPAPPVTHINLIQNWFEELKAKVPRQ